MGQLPTRKTWKIWWGGRPRPPGGPHRLESLCHRKNFSEQEMGNPGMYLPTNFERITKAVKIAIGAWSFS